MEEAPCPITSGFEKTIEVNIIKNNIEYNNIIYSFYLNKIDDNKLKFVLIQDDKIDIKFENQFDLNYFHNKNKYFKMFDSLSDLEKDLSELIKNKNITIININNNKEVNLELKVFSRNDNLVNFQLNKVELNENEKIDNLIKDISNIKEEFQKFKNDYINENKKLKEELYNKDIRISELEKKIEKILIDLEKGKKISDDGDIKLNSNIINDKNELQFLLKSISFNENIYLKLLYDSNIEGENENKLIDAYTEKKI